MRSYGSSVTFGPRTALLILVVIFGIILHTEPIVGQREKGVSFNSYDGMEIADPDIPAFQKYDRIDVEVTITSGGPVDVYIISEGQYKIYEEGGDFKSKISRERVNHTEFVFENPDSGTYFLVIDNIDNSRKNDAVPYDDVTYTYTAPIEERHHKVIMRNIWIGGIVAALIVVIVFVVWLIIFKNKNR